SLAESPRTDLLSRWQTHTTTDALRLGTQRRRAACANRRVPDGVVARRASNATRRHTGAVSRRPRRIQLPSLLVVLRESGGQWGRVPIHAWPLERADCCGTR